MHCALLLTRPLPSTVFVQAYVCVTLMFEAVGTLISAGRCGKSSSVFLRLALLRGSNYKTHFEIRVHQMYSMLAPAKVFKYMVERRGDNDSALVANRDVRAERTLRAT